MGYQPNIPLYPGITLEQHLEFVNMTQKEFAQRVGLDKKTINLIVKGKAPITHETAIKFQRVTGIPARIWNNLEQAYQQDCVRLGINLQLKQQESYLSHFSCYPNLMRLGLVKTTKIASEKVESLLGFLEISDMRLFDNVYAVNYRLSTKSTISNHNLVCWLKAGDRIAQNISIEEYSKKNIKHIISQLKQLTLDQTTIDFQAITTIMAQGGIRFVMLEHFDKVPVNGSARVFQGQPLIQISTRGKKIDSIWFTIFHELGHVYHGHNGKDMIDLNDQYDGSEEEELANMFASDSFLPKEALELLVSKSQITVQDITECAVKNNVGINIVVGRIAHDFHNSNNEIYKQVAKLRPSLR